MRIKIPGKLYLLGEYSILKTGQKAILVSVNKFINFDIKKRKEGFYIESEKGFLSFNKIEDLKEDKMIHLTEAVRMAHLYLSERLVSLKPYELKIESMLEENGNKYGLGSSGVIIIGVLKSILTYHQIHLTDLELFKLAVLTQINTFDISSGGDLAASITTGFVYYEKYDLSWVKENYSLDLIYQDWPGLVIKRLEDTFLKIVVGWTKKPSLSKEAVSKHIKVNISTDWYKEANKVVNHALEGFLKKDFQMIKESILSYQKLLDQLEVIYGYQINTTSLDIIKDSVNQIGYAGKISGAGNGDCGIGLYENRRCHKKLYQTWIENDILPLRLSVWRKKDEI